MGRVVSGVVPNGSNCVLLEKATDHVVLECNGVNVTLNRPSSPTVNHILTANNRTRCSGGGAFSCSPLPQFTSPNGSNLSNQESSFGQLWRWAPARLLARDLRFRLCGNGSYCPTSTHWTLQSFWASLMANTLINNPSTEESVNAQFQSTKPDPVDDPIWSTKWMLCTTNASGTDCSGSLSKQQWLTGNKTEQCMAVMEQHNADDASVGVTICELDDRMDELCTIIQSARYQVFEANCQLTGRSSTAHAPPRPAPAGS